VRLIVRSSGTGRTTRTKLQLLFLIGGSVWIGFVEFRLVPRTASTSPSKNPCMAAEKPAGRSEFGSRPVGSWRFYDRSCEVSRTEGNSTSLSTKAGQQQRITVFIAVERAHSSGRSKRETCGTMRLAIPARNQARYIQAAGKRPAPNMLANKNLCAANDAKRLHPGQSAGSSAPAT